MIKQLDVDKICRAFALDSMALDEGQLEIDPAPGAVLDERGRLKLLGLNNVREDVVDLAFQYCRAPETVELFVSLDCYSGPGQGLTFTSFLCIFHAQRDQAARLGTLEYGWNGGPVVRPVRWGNVYWSRYHAALLARLTGMIARTGEQEG